jgi:small-conductance mechanosensitive channel
MKTNMGGLDRILWLILVIVVAVLFFTKQITGTTAIILGVIAVVFVLTSLVGFCPLYVPLGISTKKKVRS